MRRRTTSRRGPAGPQGGWGCCCCGRTEVTTRNSFLILHNPAPWKKPFETHSLREYDFCGSPGAWVAVSESARPSDSAKRACATLPASALPGAPSRACAMQSPGRRGFGSWALARRGWVTAPGGGWPTAVTEIKPENNPFKISILHNFQERR